MLNHDESTSDAQEGRNQARVVVNRPAYSVASFEKDFAISSCDKAQKKEPKSKRLKSILAKLNPIRLFSIVFVFAEYNFKDYLIPDILSGITGNLSSLKSIYRN